MNDENILHLQSSKFSISSTSDLVSDIDGEIGSALPIEVETIPQVLDFFV